MKRIHHWLLSRLNRSAEPVRHTQYDFMLLSLLRKNMKETGADLETALTDLAFSVWSGVEEWGTTDQKEMARIIWKILIRPQYRN